MFTQRKNEKKQIAIDDLQSILLTSKELATVTVDNASVEQISELVEMLPVFLKSLLQHIIPNRDVDKIFFYNEIVKLAESKEIFPDDAERIKLTSVANFLAANGKMLSHVNLLANTMIYMHETWNTNFIESYEFIKDLRGDQLWSAEGFARETRDKACRQILQKKIENIENLHAELRKDFNKESTLNHLKFDSPGPVDELPKNFPIDEELLDPVLGKFEENLIDTYITQNFVDDVLKAYDALELVGLDQDQKYKMVHKLSATGIHAVPNFVTLLLDESIQLIQSPIGQTRELMKSVLFARMQEKNSDESGRPLMQSWQINYMMSDKFIKNLNALPNVIGFDQWRSLPQNILDDNTRQLQESFIILSDGGSLDGHNITLQSLPAATGYMQKSQDLSYYVGMTILGTLAAKLFLDKALVPLLSPWARAAAPWLRSSPAVRAAEKKPLLKQQASINDSHTIDMDSSSPESATPSTLRKRRHSEPTIPSGKKDSIFNDHKNVKKKQDTKVSPVGKASKYRK